MEIIFQDKDKVPNAPAIGIILKEAVRRALLAIRKEKITFEATTKQGYDGNMNDVFTSADKKAQEIYLRTLTECFLFAGVLAEEDYLRIDSKLPSGNTLYFTIDPLDGTKAFVRKQSHGVGSMIAMVYEDEVISAYIGDVNTLEIFGFRPNSTNVHRIAEFDINENLSLVPVNPVLNEQYILLREFSGHSKLALRTIDYMKDTSVDGGSIGTWFARLWKREFGALLIPPGKETPWDSTPIIGISQKLGYYFYRPNEVGTAWERYIPVLPTKIMDRDHDMLVVHRNSDFPVALFV